MPTFSILRPLQNLPKLGKYTIWQPWCTYVRKERKEERIEWKNERKKFGLTGFEKFSRQKRKKSDQPV
jgi:hypothetical protein